MKLVLDNIDWEAVMNEKDFTEKELMNLAEIGNSSFFYHVSQTQKMTVEFAEEHEDSLYWGYIAEQEGLEEDFITRFIHKLRLEDLISVQKLNTDHIDIVLDLIEQSEGTEYQKEKYKEQLAKYQKLNEDQMDKIIDVSVTSFFNIFLYQDVDVSYVLKYEDKIKTAVVPYYSGSKVDNYKRISLNGDSGLYIIQKYNTNLSDKNRQTFENYVGLKTMFN